MHPIIRGDMIRHISPKGRHEAVGQLTKAWARFYQLILDLLPPVVTAATHPTKPQTLLSSSSPLGFTRLYDEIGLGKTSRQ
eukprot:scaffold414118_cov14-Prasinocladus_malaysianus.AAC.1